MYSVVIPIYNHAKYLQTAVDSCLGSSLVAEILLVDDGSTDDSALIARKLAENYPSRIRNLSEAVPSNIGAHNRLNQLCESATQPWIAVLNSDDFFPSYRFELVQRLLRQSNYDLIAGSLLVTNGRGEIIGSKRGILQPEYPCPFGSQYDGPLSNVEMRLLLCSQNFIATTSNMVFKKSLFKRIGGFRDLRYAHDWDFALRATMKGHCYWTPNFLTGYRVHQTNTISEQSPHMDGEIARLFYKFLTDYPELENDARIVTALESNRHLAPFIERDNNSDLLEDDKSIETLYKFPAGLSKRAKINALLGIYYFAYDFVLLSADIDEAPLFRSSSLAESLVFKLDTENKSTRQFSAETPRGRGRYIRIPGAPTAVPRHDILSLKGWSDVKISGADMIFDRSASAGKVVPALREIASITQRSRDRPTCLVFPVFMAVGGVERNTVEMIRKLQNEYHFVVVTSERLAKSQGSLHYQLDEIDVPTIDLAEIGDRQHHLEILKVIRDVIKPDLLWICNGSPWLVENALPFRRLFATIPIIDQQVYDTERGWINQYHNKGFQAFDRFIAINAKIQGKFIRELKIPSHRVSLIYSAISANAILSSRVRAENVQLERKKLGLHPNPSRIFAFIGRLTEQKRPLVFLDLALHSKSSNSPDQFILVGDGDMRIQCQEFIKQNELTNVVQIPFSPNTSHLLAVVDGLIVTSEYEGLPIVMLEALAVATPVFATDVGDIKLIIDEFLVGTIISSVANSSDFRNAFSDWAKKLPDYKIQAMAVQDQVLERFSSDTAAEKYLKCFDSCLEDYYRPRASMGEPSHPKVVA